VSNRYPRRRPLSIADEKELMKRDAAARWLKRAESKRKRNNAVRSSRACLSP
jgi:hypothetical protein